MMTLSGPWWAVLWIYIAYSMWMKFLVSHSTSTHMYTSATASPKLPCSSFVLQLPPNNPLLGGVESGVPFGRGCFMLTCTPNLKFYHYWHTYSSETTTQLTLQCFLLTTASHICVHHLRVDVTRRSIPTMWILEEVLDGAVLGKNISHTTSGLHILDKTCTHTHVCTGWR